MRITEKLRGSGSTRLRSDAMHAHVFLKQDQVVDLRRDTLDYAARPHEGSPCHVDESKPPRNRQTNSKLKANKKIVNVDAFIHCCC